jgi:hypothetical protein
LVLPEFRCHHALAASRDLKASEFYRKLAIGASRKTQCPLVGEIQIEESQTTPVRRSAAGGIGDGGADVGWGVVESGGRRTPRRTFVAGGVGHGGANADGGTAENGGAPDAGERTSGRRHRDRGMHGQGHPELVARPRLGCGRGVRTARLAHRINQSYTVSISL